MHIVVDTQGTDRVPEEGGCKRDSCIAEQLCTLYWTHRELIENQKKVVVKGTVA